MIKNDNIRNQVLNSKAELVVEFNALKRKWSNVLFVTGGGTFDFEEVDSLEQAIDRQKQLVKLLT